jgi:proteasome lid subunit RPN8/RPN11
VVVPAVIRRQLEEHAAAEAPNEACGLIAFRDGVAERFLPADNEAASPYRFELKPRALDDFYLEDEGYELAVFHSHPTESARPSRTDVENIGLWEGKPYFILSRPLGELRAWSIRDGQVDELPFTAAPA